MERNVWHRSSRSGSNGACVEVADLGGAVGVRDSKDPAGPALTFTPTQWRSFTTTLKAGRADRR